MIWASHPARALAAVLTAAVILTIGLSVCAASVYHVAREHASASDQNPGTAELPFRTISRGSEEGRPGDTILVHDGIYRERVVLSRSGTREGPITLRGAVVDGTGVGIPEQRGLVELDRVEHIRLKDLEIRHSSQDGILAVLPKGVVIRSVNVHHCGRSGIMLTQTKERSDSSVVDCDVHHNTLAGIAVWQCPGGYFVLRGNRVHNNLGVSNWDGIEIIDTPYVAVLGNTVYDNAPEEGRPEGDQIDAGGTNALTSPSHHVIYEGNLVYGRGGGVKMNNEPLHCIIRRNVILDTGLVFYEGPTRIAVCHNTIVDGPHALQFWGDGTSEDFGGTQVRNNLFVDSTSYTVSIGNRAVPSTESISLDHNVYRFRRGNPRGINVNAPDFDATFPPTGDGLAAFWERTGLERNGCAVTQPRNELFADPGDRDFRPKAGSAAIDSGGPLTTVVSQLEPTLLRVGNAWSFQDGWHGLLKPDTVRIGEEIVAVVAVDYDRHELRLAQPVTAEPGAPIAYPFAGRTPDAGAREYGQPANGPATVTFYVDPDWENNATGAARSPWPRLDEAAWRTINRRLAVANVTVFLSAREAEEDEDERTTSSISVLRTDKSEHRLILDGMSKYNAGDQAPDWREYRGTSRHHITHDYPINSATRSEKRSHVTIRGFKLVAGATGRGGQGIAWWGGDHVVIEHCEITKHEKVAHGPGIILNYAWNKDGSAENGGCTDITIRNNVVHAVYGEGIYIGGSHDADKPAHRNITIENNVIYDVAVHGGEGDAIDVKDGSTNVVIRGNTCYMTEAGAGRDGIVCASNCLIEGNFVYNFGRAGISLGTYWNAHRVRAGSVVRNNVVVNTGGNPKYSWDHGIIVSGSEDGDNYTGLGVYNNTICSVRGDREQSGVGLAISRSAKGARVVNNLVCNSAFIEFAAEEGCLDTCEHNLFFSPRADAVLVRHGRRNYTAANLTDLDPRSLGVDPLLISIEPPYAVENFRLREGSPANGAGVKLGSFELDISGKPRGDQWAIGAAQ